MPYLYDAVSAVVTLFCFLVLSVLVLAHFRRSCLREGSCFQSYCGVIADENDVGKSPKSAAHFQRSPASSPRRSRISSLALPNLQRTPSMVSQAVTVYFQSFSFPEGFERKRKIAELMTWVNIATSLSMVGLALCARLSYFNLIPINMNCRTFSVSLSILYIMIRCSLFSVFVNRVDLAFHGTIYAYSERTIRLCYSLVILVFVTMTSLAFIMVDSDDARRRYARDGDILDSNEESQRRMRFCKILPNLVYSSSLVIFELVWITVMVRMFVGPLRNMFNRDDRLNSAMSDSHRNSRLSVYTASSAGGMTNNNTNDTTNHGGSMNSIKDATPDPVSVDDEEDPELRATPLPTLKLGRSSTNEFNRRESHLNQRINIFDVEMKLLPLKYSVLSMMSVVSTVLALLVLAVGYGAGVTIDNVVNVGCLVLMSQEWSPEFWLLCGPILGWMHHCGIINDRTQERLSHMTRFHYGRRRAAKNGKDSSNATSEERSREHDLTVNHSGSTS